MKNDRRKKCPGLALLLMAVSVTSWLSAQEVTIRKSAADANPPLYIGSIQAPPAVERQLVNTLKRCNWFEIVSSPDKARYNLQASYARSGSAVLKIRLTSEGSPVLSLTKTAQGGDADRIVYAAVDQLIQELFDNPGPCDSLLAFVVGQGDQKEIFTCNFDGTNPRQLTRNGTISTEPAWGPGGRQLVYTLYNRSRTAVVLLDHEKGRQRRITAFPGLNSGAAIAPGRNRIALCLSLDKKVDLYTLSMAGQPQKRLTNSNAVESSPSWSPDGRRLCYVSDRAGRPLLYIKSLSTGKSKRLLRGSAEQVSPDWSPVSNKICFSTRQDGRYVIAVADPADPGGRMQVVTPEPGDWESPSWAPDGRHLVCVHSHGGRHRLVMVDTVSGRVIPILQKKNISLPSWGGSK